MIKKINSSIESKFSRYNQIKYTGYTAIGATVACGLSGLKSVKLPQKSMIHKTSAIISLISMLWHLGAIKQWDKHFMEHSEFGFNKK